ncbi:glycosyltransferase family 2 protein [Escherichia coli]|uniref:glycosyltransferase family 2 protein n=1 Tax=Escherichia coli TaxID=562 RepID=UPI000FC0D109|nr:glycosyltransferase [Escherichia coli]EJQ0210282.1 glycosyltransferase [Escherichia coli]MBY8658497.1 glycosyltransferase [Escherichia coli]MIB34999.1 glycosyltransferase [Escherichia coli]HAJ8125829.1 glycosyltransferase [Escherichia coli]HCJ9405825.1 glycosyltransferase [Escherichia coli]
MSDIITRNTCPSISVIILSYNGEKYIEETIISVLSQDYKNIAIIIVDDNSKDSTLDILHKYSNHPSIKVIFNTENKGIARNLNDTIALIDSDYFLLLGHDDLIPPDHLSIMINEFKDDVVSIHCNSYIIDSEGNKNKLLKIDSIQKTKNNTLNIRQELALDNFISSCGMLHRTKIFKLINGWDEKYRNYGEWLYYIKSLDYGIIKYTTKTKAFYRRHETNITNTFKDRNIKYGVYLYKKTCRQLGFKKANKSFTFLLRYLYANFKSYLYVFKK